MNTTIRLLFVDNEPNYLRVFEREMKQFGYQHIKCIDNVPEFERSLKEVYFDVIVLDMNMGNSDLTGGLNMLEVVENNHITSAVIILTANDTVTNCRQAFLQGAWDYISKNWEGDTFEMVHDSIQNALQKLNRWGNVDNDRWFNENKTDLMQKRPGQWIAILNQDIIESAYTKDELIKKLRGLSLPAVATTIEHVLPQVHSPNLQNEHLMEIINEDENQTVDFKKTACRTMNPKATNPKEPKAIQKIVKEVASFMNSKVGGAVIIGVRDKDHEIVGVELDYVVAVKQKSRQNWDGYESFIRQILDDNLTSNKALESKIYRHELAGKMVCRIAVPPAKSEVYHNDIKKTTCFSVRDGSRSKTLNVRETVSYVLANHSANS